MSEFILFMAAPTVMCFILAGIHCYLGLHVLARGVIFVDLSLAQIAALGATMALIFGEEQGSLMNYVSSLGATFIAASLFAFARSYEKYFSQEAIIGIVYALGAAAVVLTVDRMAHGAEHIKELLVGQILWVSWGDVLKTGTIYSAVGAVHFIFRKQLFDASYKSSSQGNGKWDFLFYSLFGVVITSSVNIVGVLQVFTYLIVPSVVSSLFFASIRARLLFGWLLGIVVSVIGMGLSYFWDLPSGAFIVFCFTIIPIFLLLGSPLIKRRFLLGEA